jgi:hypothetical protein
VGAFQRLIHGENHQQCLFQNYNGRQGFYGADLEVQVHFLFKPVILGIEETTYWFGAYDWDPDKPSYYYQIEDGYGVRPVIGLVLWNAVSETQSLYYRLRTTGAYGNRESKQRIGQ